MGACTNLGFSVCATVTALNGTGNATVLVDQEQRWAGQPPLRPRPSWPMVEPPLNFSSVEERWAMGIEAQCLDYNTTSRQWQNGTLYGELPQRQARLASACHTAPAAAAAFERSWPGGLVALLCMLRVLSTCQRGNPTYPSKQASSLFPPPLHALLAGDKEQWDLGVARLVEASQRPGCCACRLPVPRLTLSTAGCCCTPSWLC